MHASCIQISEDIVCVVRNLCICLWVKLQVSAARVNIGRLLEECIKHAAVDGHHKFNENN